MLADSDADNFWTFVKLGLAAIGGLIVLGTIWYARYWRGSQVANWAKAHGMTLVGNVISGREHGLVHSIEVQMDEKLTYTKGWGSKGKVGADVRTFVIARVETGVRLPAGFVVSSARNIGIHKDGEIVKSGASPFDAAFTVSAQDVPGARRIIEQDALRRQIAYLASLQSDFQVANNSARFRIGQVLGMDGDPAALIDQAVSMALTLAICLTNAANGHEVAEPPVDVLAQAELPVANMPKNAKIPSSAPKMPARRAGPKKP